ncbi:DinB family protein [Fibrisoma montanum]|uniref:DinB family protein n=1 Tax=Fibrisoma montanum TaxID=2305895 RepID=A0A418MFL5_9BACT|nr:DinB family protein [Fibrisoma montanum]RIV25555.1 DinB family protein [Fibrisoma montanum]
MTNTHQLLQQVAVARRNYLTSLAGMDESQAQWKPAPDAWNAVEITEHLFWAEQGGILGMWKTLLSIRAGTVSFEGASPNGGLPVEDIIRRTWQEKEIVPPVAAPRMGGPLGFWASALAGLQSTLEAFGELLTDEDLLIQAHPHPISGPMTFGQRLEFLRFHIDRHRGQVERLNDSFAESISVLR